MLIEEKYFRSDKNYLLKTVQAFSKEMLLDKWIDQIFSSYNELHNPMGLEDDFIIHLRSQIKNGKALLHEAYDLLAAAYRYYHSDNQLEFQWDGRSHMDSYDEEWKAKYDEWIKALSQSKEILRPVIKYATTGEETNNDFLKASIRRGILNRFQLRMRSQRLFSVSA